MSAQTLRRMLAYDRREAAVIAVTLSTAMRGGGVVRWEMDAAAYAAKVLAPLFAPIADDDRGTGPAFLYGPCTD